jgi:predicted class III extradiol MEMO1 family dioxygenase
MMQVTDAETSQTLGTLIQWANHPENIVSKNLLISSDFTHYLREAVEKGVYLGEALSERGSAALPFMVNGAHGWINDYHAAWRYMIRFAIRCM